MIVAMTQERSVADWTTKDSFRRGHFEILQITGSGCKQRIKQDMVSILPHGCYLGPYLENQLATASPIAVVRASDIGMCVAQVNTNYLDVSNAHRVRYISGGELHESDGPEQVSDGKQVNINCTGSANCTKNPAETERIIVSGILKTGESYMAIVYWVGQSKPRDPGKLRALYKSCQLNFPGDLN